MAPDWLDAATQIQANLKGLWAGTWLPEGIQDWLCSEATIRFDRPMPFQLGGDAEGYREQLKLTVDQEAVELVDFTDSVHWAPAPRRSPPEAGQKPRPRLFEP